MSTLCAAGGRMRGSFNDAGDPRRKFEQA